jgi:hypothetical protein
MSNINTVLDMRTRDNNEKAIEAKLAEDEDNYVKPIYCM